MNNLQLTQKQKFLSLNAFQIKILACAFMLIDHLGYILFPEYPIFRIIGRLAFPLFAFMIANGFYYTKNRTKYLLRLAIFGAAIQVPFYIFTHSSLLNIFFTLSLGLVAIWLFDYLKKWSIGWGWLCVAACAAIAQLLHFDYHCYGILIIFTSYLMFNNPKKLIIPWSIVSVGYFLLQCLTSAQGFAYQWPYIQLFALVATVFVLRYNRQEGKKSPLLFYIFYPAHLGIIYLIAQLIH